MKNSHIHISDTLLQPYFNDAHLTMKLSAKNLWIHHKDNEQSNRFIFTIYFDKVYPWSEYMGARFVYRWGISDSRTIYYAKLSDGRTTMDDFAPRNMQDADKLTLLQLQAKIIDKWVEPADEFLRRDWDSLKNDYTDIDKLVNQPWFICYDQEDILETVQLTAPLAIKKFDAYISSHSDLLNLTLPRYST